MKAFAKASRSFGFGSARTHGRATTRAFATPVLPSGVQGTGAPLHRGQRLSIVLATAMLVTLAFALSAAPASASKTVFDFFGGTGSGAGQFAAGEELFSFEPGPTGLAVNDTTGDIYVADRVNNRINQFDSEEHFIRAWGADVIPGGTTGFEKCTTATTCKAGAPTGIGGAMKLPQGVAINQSNQNVYVTDTGNRRVNQYDASGTFIRSWGANVVESGSGNTIEAQSIKVGATSGTFILIYSNESTSPLPYNATAGEVETALNALGAIGGVSGSVSVTGGPGNATGSNPYQATFGGTLVNTDVDQIELDTSALGIAEGTVLSCTAGPAGATLNYQWLRGGAEIAGATSATYTTVAADASQTVQCKTKAANSEGASVKASTLPVTVSPAPGVTPPVPLSTNAGILSGVFTVGGELTCGNGSWSGSPTFTYQWLRNGNPIAGATSSTYTLQAADNQTAFQCEVTGTNAGGAVVADSAEVRIISAESPGNNGGLGSVPTISGTASVGNVLTCGNGSWSGSPTFTYQWLRNGNPIAGANINTYTAVVADEGAAIQCKVTAASASAAAAVSVNKVIAPTPSPLPPSRPSTGQFSFLAVSGSPSIGATLTCPPTSGIFEEEKWTPVSPAPAFTYQWLRNGVAIPGATLSTYSVVSADLDKLVQCQTTATNTKGASAAITASTFSPVIHVNPPVATANIQAPSTATTITQGASVEICNAGVDVCRAGVAPASPKEFGGTFGNNPNMRVAVAPGGPYAGDVFVSDPGFFRVQIFNPNTGVFVAAFGQNVLRSGAETAGKNVCIASLGNVCKGGQASNNPPNTYGFGVEANQRRGLAIDSTGAIYVPGPRLAFLQKYSPDLSSEQDFAPSLCSGIPTSSSENQGCDEVVVDPSTDDVYVTHGIMVTEEVCSIFFGCFLSSFLKERRIARFDSTGGDPPVEAGLLTNAGVAKINGLAVDGSTGNERSGRVYFTTNKPEQRVDVLGEPTPPTVEIDPIDPEDVKADEVTVKGAINPNGDKLNTTYHFEILAQGSSWKSHPIPDVDLGNGTSPVTFEQTITSLKPYTDYKVRLAAFKGSRTLSPEQTFTTLQSGPDAVTGVARWSGPPSSNPSLTFSGTVNDNNLPAHFYFEYGADASYGSRVPIFESATFPAGQEPFLARQTVNGLDPSDTYHYRLVARTSSGTSLGADHEVGPAQSGGRFPELVSPTNKGVGTIGVFLTTSGIKQLSWQASPSGDRMAYMYEYGDTDAYSGGELLYLAKREGSSWANEQLNPPSTVPPLGSSSYGYTAATPGLVKWLSPKMDCGFVMSHGNVTGDVSPLDIENNIWHLYRRSDDGSFTRITPSPLNTGNNSVKVRGATADCSRVIFQSVYKYLPGMPAEEKAHIYEWEEMTPGTGTLRAVDVLPDGTIPADGSLRTEEGPAKFLGGGEVEMNAVSLPGASRVFFVATSNQGGDSGKKAIFVRKNHATTVDVSQSQTATPNNGTTEYQMASEDGSHVFFTARAGLASNSVTTTGINLYDYNVDTGVLKDLTPDANPADTAGASVVNMLGASEDGSYAYFAAKGQLVAGQGKTYAANNSGNFYNVYLAHSGALSYVGMMTLGDGQEGAFVAGQVPAVLLGDPAGRLQTRVTSSGQYLLFRSSVNLTPYDSGGFRELYRYSAPGSSVACVSCRADGQPPFGSAQNFFLTSQGNDGNDIHHQRSISDDGSRIFFNSTDKLTIDAKENGDTHVYEWHDGTVSLLVNNGKILDSSADGSSAFVFTTEPLIPQDQDGVPDVYAFRIEGGFPYTAKERCDPLSEGSCQGNPPPPPPATAAPASSTFNGPGNPPVPGAKQHKKHHKKQGKKHHKKHGKANKQRAAKHNGGGSK